MTVLLMIMNVAKLILITTTIMKICIKDIDKAYIQNSQKTDNDINDNDRLYGGSGGVDSHRDNVDIKIPSTYREKSPPKTHRRLVAKNVFEGILFWFIYFLKIDSNNETRDCSSVPFPFQ